jgi:hypothetical protein
VFELAAGASLSSKLAGAIQWRPTALTIMYGAH